MKLVIYVATDDDLISAEEIISAVIRPSSTDSLTAVNLYGAEFGKIPAEVLQVLRLKRRDAIPLIFADAFPILAGRLPTVEELETALRDGVTEPGIVMTEAGPLSALPPGKQINLSWLVNDTAESTRFYEVFPGRLLSGCGCGPGNCGGTSAGADASRTSS